MEVYRENGQTHRFTLDEYPDPEAARDEAREMNACYERLGVRDHWIEVQVLR